MWCAQVTREKSSIRSIVCYVCLRCNVTVICFFQSRILLTEYQNCHDNSSIETAIYHAINFPLLDAFYNLTEQPINGQNLFLPKDFKESSPIEWQLFSERTNQSLASSKRISLSLNRLAESFSNDTPVFQHSSEAVLHDYMNQLLDTSMTPYINSWLDWKFYLPWVPAVLLLPVIITLLRQHSRIPS